MIGWLVNSRSRFARANEHEHEHASGRTYAIVHINVVDLDLVCLIECKFDERSMITQTRTYATERFLELESFDREPVVSIGRFSLYRTRERQRTAFLIIFAVLRLKKKRGKGPPRVS